VADKGHVLIERLTWIALLIGRFVQGAFDDKLVNIFRPLG
jgi:hypothetical protein